MFYLQIARELEKNSVILIMKEREITGVDPIDKIRSLFAPSNFSVLFPVIECPRRRLSAEARASFPSSPIFSSYYSPPESIHRPWNAIMLLLTRPDSDFTSTSSDYYWSCRREFILHYGLAHLLLLPLPFSSFPSRELLLRNQSYFSPRYIWRPFPFDVSTDAASPLTSLFLSLPRPWDLKCERR